MHNLYIYIGTKYLVTALTCTSLSISIIIYVMMSCDPFQTLRAAEIRSTNCFIISMIAKSERLSLVKSRYVNNIIISQLIMYQTPLTLTYYNYVTDLG